MPFEELKPFTLSLAGSLPDAQEEPEEVEPEPERPPPKPAPRPKPVPARPRPNPTPARLSPPAKKTPAQSAPRTPVVSRQPPPEKHPVPIGHLLPANAPHLRVPHAALDRFRALKPGPRVVCEEIYRAAAGWHSDECVISIAKLAAHCQIEEKYVRKYVTQLQSLGYIERLGAVLGGRDLEARGVRFRVLLPRLAKGTGAQSAGGDNRPPYKGKDLNNNSKSVVCDLCRETGGFIYPEGFGGPVKRCDHRHP